MGGGNFWVGSVDKFKAKPAGAGRAPISACCRTFEIANLLVCFETRVNGSNCLSMYGKMRADVRRTAKVTKAKLGRVGTVSARDLAPAGIWLS
jgi:hypothetical protein